MIATKARHAEDYDSLGFVYSKQQKLEEAMAQRHSERSIAYYQRAAEIRPDFANAQQNLRITLAQQEDNQPT